MRTLRRREIELLRDEWERGGEAAVGSDDVYRRLREEGWEVPDYDKSRSGDDAHEDGDD